MPIIKQLRRKSSSHAQLLKYINKGRKEGDKYFFRHNIYSSDPYYIVREFKKTEEILKKRKNGNILYHEIISIKYQDAYTKEELREILIDMTEKYIQERANNCLVYGVIHEQHNQIHFHLMISSNEVGSPSPLRFSKAEFAKKQNLTRQYSYERYPKLERLEPKESKARAKAKSIDAETHFKKRTGKPSKRENFRARLKTILALSKNPSEFAKFLRIENIEIYKRGNTFGFLNKTDNLKYRLRVLELEQEFKQMSDDFEKIYQKSKEETRNNFENEKEKKQKEDYKNDFEKD